MTKSSTIEKGGISGVTTRNVSTLDAKESTLTAPCEQQFDGECQSPTQLMDACEEVIRELAYLKWEAAGCPSGDGFDFWLEAEQEVFCANPCSKTLDA